MTTIKEHVIDATHERLGRLATKVSVILIGKDTATFARNIAAPVRVRVVNASKLHIDERKRQQKTYDRYSGYPDGRRVLTMTDVVAKKGYAELVRKAVYGMLPSNKLRAKRMKMLIVSE